MYPNGDDRDSFDNVSWYREPIVFNQETSPGMDLNGTYYLAVEGFDASYYYLRALLTYKDKDGKIVNSTIKLHEGTA